MKKPRIVKPGFWWASVNPDERRPPCIWGPYRADVQADTDEYTVRLYVCEATDKKGQAGYWRDRYSKLRDAVGMAPLSDKE